MSVRFVCQVSSTFNRISLPLSLCLYLSKSETFLVKFLSFEVFCTPTPVCSTCRTKFPMSTLKRFISAKPKARVKPNTGTRPTPTVGSWTDPAPKTCSSANCFYCISSVLIQFKWHMQCQPVWTSFGTMFVWGEGGEIKLEWLTKTWVCRQWNFSSICLSPSFTVELLYNTV